MGYKTHITKPKKKTTNERMSAAHTAFFGFGEPSKTIPELTLEAAQSSVSLDRVILAFLKLRDDKDHDTAYYHDGNIVLEHLKKHAKQLSKKIDKLTVNYNKEVKEHVEAINL